MHARDRALAVIAAALLGGAYGMIRGLDGAQLFVLCTGIWLLISLAQELTPRRRRGHR